MSRAHEKYPCGCTAADDGTLPNTWQNDITSHLDTGDTCNCAHDVIVPIEDCQGANLIQSGHTFGCRKTCPGCTGPRKTVHMPCTHEVHHLIEGCTTRPRQSVGRLTTTHDRVTCQKCLKIMRERMTT